MKASKHNQGSKWQETIKLSDEINKNRNKKNNTPQKSEQQRDDSSRKSTGHINPFWNKIKNTEMISKLTKLK